MSNENLLPSVRVGIIYKKMSQVMSDIGSISKDQKNQAQGFKFRGIDQFVNALYPALTKHSVFMAPECVSESHEIREVTRSNGKAGTDKHVTLLMKYHFYAEDGSSVTIGPVPAEGLDSGDKATNKALSAGLKYALIQTFSIPTEDMAEADLETPEIQGKRLDTQTSSAQASPKTSLSPPSKLTSFRKPQAVSTPVTLTEAATAVAAGDWE